MRNMDDEEEMDRIRRNQAFQLVTFPEGKHDDLLTLSLSPPIPMRWLTPQYLPSPPRPPPPPPTPPPSPPPPPPTYYQLYLSPLIDPPSNLVTNLSMTTLVASSSTTLALDPFTSTPLIDHPEPCPSYPWATTDPSITTLVPNSTTTTTTTTTTSTLAAGPLTSTPLIAHPESRPSFHTRRNPTQAPRGGKGETIPAPYPWATNRRATVHSLDYLFQNGLVKISGSVQCKRCERKYEIEFDLERNLLEVVKFIALNKSNMHDRAPKEWTNATLPTCKYCEQANSVKPIIALKKKEINWLFLLLGQLLGCCTLDQLKYFCKHTRNHRTGAKDRVLYLTYLTLCKQLHNLNS